MTIPVPFTKLSTDGKAALHKLTTHQGGLTTQQLAQSSGWSLQRAFAALSELEAVKFCEARYFTTTAGTQAEAATPPGSK